MHEIAVGLVGRRVERDLDLDAALGAGDLHALEGRGLGRDGEGQLPALAEIGKPARRAVGLEVGIAVEHRRHRLGLGIEDVARHGDRIAADVEQPAAADLGDVAHILGIID